MLDKLAFKIKRALYKSPDRTARRLLTFAAAIALLRENRKVSEMDDDEFESLIDLYSQDEKVIKEARLLEMGRTPFNYFALDEEIANAGGPMTGGNIAGIGTDSQGEPGRNPSMMPLQKRKKKKKEALDHARRHCSHTSKKTLEKTWINANTVIQACLFMRWSERYTTSTTSTTNM
jgi:hypothetical protein